MPVRPRPSSSLADTWMPVLGAQVLALMRRGSWEVEVDTAEKWTVTNDSAVQAINWQLQSTVERVRSRLCKPAKRQVEMAVD